jgi:hypothetical protein
MFQVEQFQLSVFLFVCYIDFSQALELNKNEAVHVLLCLGLFPFHASGNGSKLNSDTWSR